MSHPKPTTEALRTACERVRSVHQRADREMAGLIERGASEGMTLACRAGCAGCCTYAFSTVEQEALVVTDAVQALPRAHRDAVIARLASWERAWRLHAGSDTIGTERNVVGWQAKHRACPMLDPSSHRCLVYADRPLVCRVHHACEPRADIPVPCRMCQDIVPGDGCMTTPAGHLAHVLMFRNDLIDVWTQEIVMTLTVAGQGVVPGIFPLQVLAIGRRLYGWKQPAKIVPLPVLKHARVRGDR